MDKVSFCPISSGIFYATSARFWSRKALGLILKRRWKVCVKLLGSSNPHCHATSATERFSSDNKSERALSICIAQMNSFGVPPVSSVIRRRSVLPLMARLRAIVSTLISCCGSDLFTSSTNRRSKSSSEGSSLIVSCCFLVNLDISIIYRIFTPAFLKNIINNAHGLPQKPQELRRSSD